MVNLVFPDSMPLEWVNGGLRVTSTDVLQRLDRSTFSASSMKSLDSCPARYVAERLLPREDDPFGPAEIGSSAHTVFENLYNDIPARRTLERAWQHAIDLSYKVWEESKEVERHQWLRAVMDKVEPLWKIEDPKKIDVIANEEKFDGLELGGVPFIGFIDRTERLPDGSVRISDLKTGKATTAAEAKRWGDDDGDQLRLYVAAYMARYGERPKSAALLYTSAGRSRQVSITKPQVQKALDRFTRNWNTLKRSVRSQVFPCKTSALCGWCPLVNTCPAALSEEKEARKEGLPTSAELPIPVKANKVDDGLDSLVAHLENTYPENDEIDVFEAAEMGHEDTHPAHLVGGKTIEETNVIEGFADRERRPYDDPPKNGDLDPNSYAATALFGLTGMAVEILGKADVRLTKSAIRAFSGTLAHIVLAAQEDMVGEEDWYTGANTRIRGALRSVLDVSPPPFGGDASAWKQWVNRSVKRCVAIAETVVEIHQGDHLDKPWLILAVDDDEAEAA